MAYSTGGEHGHPASISRLQETVRLLEAQRARLWARRRRQLWLIGGSISIVFHLVLLIYLGTVFLAGGTVGGNPMLVYEFAILNQVELTALEQTEFDDLTSEPSAVDESFSQPDELAPAVEPVVAATPSLEFLPGLSASGAADTRPALGGGGETSFFGVSSKGTRFAYIVDVSGSMGQDRKLEVAMRELARSIESLPDYAHFYIVLFSTDFLEPPMQHGWTKARKSTVNHFIRWLESVEPSGGTQPRSAFLQVFSLDVRPEVIFFLTDGQIEDFTVEELADLNARGKKAVVNTIAFGDPTSQDLLKRIAAESGGAYRFVPSEAAE